MYGDLLIDHFKNPRNVGELAPPAVTIEVSNPICGDILRLSVRFDQDTVAEARYKTRGCTASIAAGSALTVWMAGKAKPELRNFRPDMMDDLLGGLQTESKHVAALCADALQSLLKAAR